MRLLIRHHRGSPELGWGSHRMLDRPHAAVPAHLCSWDDGALVAVHNPGPEPRTVPPTVPECGSGHRLVDLLQHGVQADGAVEPTLEGYGYRWLRVFGPDSRRPV